MDFLEKPKDTKPLIVNMVTGECTVGGCPFYAKEINLFAGIVKGQFRVAHVACNEDSEVCMNMPKPEPKNNSATILVTSQAIYSYEGNQTKEGLLEFLSAENFMTSKVLEEPFDDYA